jgi:CheY-like chemotaxis protein
MSLQMRKIRVLVFEDDRIVRDLLRRLLEMRNYEVHTYEDPSICPLHGLEACECSAHNFCADIIISDIQMPNIDGLTFIKSQLEKGCKVAPSHIALISGYWVEKYRSEADRLGLTTMQKPFQISALDEWLDECENNIDLDRSLIDEDSLKAK